MNKTSHNYGREFHARWARTWRRWFVGEVAIAVVFGSLGLALAALIVWAFAVSTSEQIGTHLPSVINTCILAAVLIGAATSFAFGARTSWRNYTTDRDLARKAAE